MMGTSIPLYESGNSITNAFSLSSSISQKGFNLIKGIVCDSNPIQFLSNSVRSVCALKKTSGFVHSFGSINGQQTQ